MTITTIVKTLELAYLDPGTGSLILQALASLFLGAFVAIKMFWGRIKAFLSFSSKKNSEDHYSDEYN